MSTIPQVTSSSDEVSSTHNPAGLPKNAPDNNDSSTINDVESLKKGIIKTSKNKVKAPYTLLLVGETGTGKTSVLEFIANVLSGRKSGSYDLGILGRTNEQVGPSNQSKTSSPRLYEFTSQSGVVVRVIDTPGLADTRGIEQDERHKANIATQFKKHIDSITAVLILANGTVERLSPGTDYALSTLSALFPKSLITNIAFVFSNIPNPLARNFAEESIPTVLKDAHQFFLDNPCALQKKLVELMNKGKLIKPKEQAMRKYLETSEESALDMLVELFDWLDGVIPQPTTEIVNLYGISQEIESTITDALAQMDQAAAKKEEINGLMADLKNDSKAMETSVQFETTVTLVAWRQQRTPTNNMVCGQISCYTNCYIDYKINIPLELSGIFGGLCPKCNHSLRNHHRYYAEWKQVIDVQVSVDQDMKEKWEAAKEGEEKREVFIAACGKALDDLDQVMNRATNNLRQLVERHERLSLGGSFAAQVSCAVRLLEQKYGGLQAKKGVSLDLLQKVQTSLDGMKRRLTVLTIAKEDTQKATVRIGS